MNTPIVLITGALTGIGRATALAFAREGASLVVSGRRDDAGQVGMAGASVYVASKHAVEGLTKSAALEGAAAGVRVNAVAPGPIQTDMLERFTGGDEAAKNGFLASLPARRAGTPEEIAQTIVFLASDKARFLTGQSVSVDGGYTAQ
jgi:NAD(P)-dependent dehydrogenase (short-subunit alcohol dehydrogenase family)